jgi:hypothetical protein
MFMPGKLTDPGYSTKGQPMLSFWSKPVLPVGYRPETTARKLCWTRPNAAELR